MHDTTTVKAVNAGQRPFTLHVTWRDDGKDTIDLTGLIHRSRHFRVFLDQPKSFRDVRVVNYGSGIGWANGLDYGADTLKEMAEEQRPLRGKDLVKFAADFDLDTHEIGALLDTAPRTIRVYRKAKHLPQAVAIALRHLMKNQTALAAHYKPVRQRPRGRPKKTATG